MRWAPALPAPKLELVRAARYSGYRRQLDRMAAGVLTTLEATDTDAGAALVAYVAYLGRLAGHVMRQQKKCLREWERQRADRARIGRSVLIEPDLSRGLGARLDALHRAVKCEQLLHTALGLFASAGMVRLRLQREGDVANVGDLPVCSLDERGDVVTVKGRIRQLRDEKWREVYNAASPRGLFTRGEMRAA